MKGGLHAISGGETHHKTPLEAAFTPALCHSPLPLKSRFAALMRRKTTAFGLRCPPLGLPARRANRGLAQGPRQRTLHANRGPRSLESPPRLPVFSRRPNCRSAQAGQNARPHRTAPPMPPARYRGDPRRSLRLERLASGPQTLASPSSAILAEPGRFCSRRERRKSEQPNSGLTPRIFRHFDPLGPICRLLYKPRHFYLSRHKPPQTKPTYI